MGIKTFSNDWLDRVSAGKVQGASIIYKHGACELNSSSYVPFSLDTVYQTPTSPVYLEILSDDSDDNISGTGARTVLVEGIGSDWGPQSTLVEMNGTSAVALPDPFLRVHEIKVITSGAYASQTVGSHEGDIVVREVGGGSLWGSIRYYDGLAVGHSLIGVYTVPLGFTAHIIGTDIYTGDSKEIDAVKMLRSAADIVSAPFSPMVLSQFVRSRGLNTLIRPKSFSEEIIGPADVGFLIKRVGSGIANVELNMDILLLDQR